MIKFNSKLTAGAALTALLLAGCGGGSSSGVAGVAPDTGTTISDVVAYINTLIASVDANSDPVDINGFTVATDDTAEPTALN